MYIRALHDKPVASRLRQRPLVKLPHLGMMGTQAAGTRLRSVVNATRYNAGERNE